MSIDSDSQCVRSKYFLGKTAMDESLSDFQETKQNCRGPKATQKAVKSKTKKVPKAIKGQKDIRSALKSKKNELISYTKEFNTICKKSGLDVDSEQLQLAIALSKSLRTESPDDTSTSQTLSTKSRIAKIRTTLQEYGFKVPDKITTVNKRVKKHRKQYKLINTTAEEKHQKITSKYSQILFKCNFSINKDSAYVDKESPIYNIATNLNYDSMKDNNIFYVDNLVEKSNTNGCLFKNWSEIPGRPISPDFHTNIMDFSEILCSQDELDIVLSGSIKSAQSIISTKQVRTKETHIPEVVKNDDGKAVGKDNCKEANNDFVTIVDDEETTNKSLDKVGKVNKDLEIVELESNSITVREQYRSCSPDIFDDEVSCIMEVSKPILSQEHKTRLFTEETNYMDLTECASSIKTSQNITKRRSDDFMEITDCAVTASQGTHDNVKEIDLTQISIETNNKKDDTLNIAESPYNFTENDEVLDHIVSESILREDVDLTQSFNEDNNRTNHDKTVFDNKKHESVDLTQSSKSSVDIDDLPEVIIDTQKSLDDTIILNPEEYLAPNSEVKKPAVQNDEIFDLTQANNEKEATASNFYEDFVHNHSDSKENSENNELCVDNNRVHNTSNEDIDLTQSSDGSAIEAIPSNSSLGKRDQVSIDYDEICEISDKEDTQKTVKDCLNFNNSKSEASNDLSNLSQNSQFDLVDTELDYSLHKSRYEEHNFDFGGISYVDDIIGGTETKAKLLEDSFDVKKAEEKCIETNSGQSIPIVTPKNGEYIVKTNEVTPMLDYTSMTTPQRNRELDKYGVKPLKRKRAIQILTHLYNQTHPIIKPCSDEEQPTPSKKPRHSPRKQLKTSRSFQTSPQKQTVRNSKSAKKCNKSGELQTSPLKQAIGNSKSLKKCSKSGELQTSPYNQTFRDSSSSKKGSERGSNSLIKDGDSSRENLCFYEVCDMPIIRSVDCHPDDWVFQKREKAKVHSCRVPLHIAFHNYVSSRRDLREAILKYEPVNIDVIHKDLVSYGHRYDPKDLLRFLDKKCITVKTADNNARNKR